MQTTLSKRNGVFAVILLILAVAAGWWLLTPQEGVYRGRPVSFWVRQLQITQIGQKNDTLDVLLNIGPDCLPTLATELQTRDGFITKGWQKLWPKLPVNLRKILPQPSSGTDRRATAAWALGQIGPAARPTTPVLVMALGDSEDRVRAEAAHALRWLGTRTPEVITALARCLSDQAPMVRSWAAEGLWNMAPESQGALPALIQLLGAPDLAYHSALCMQELGPLASNAVPALIEVVHRGAAGRPLNWKFPMAVGANGIPGDKDPSAHNRAMAAKALGKISVANSEVIETLQAALSYPPTLEGVPGRRRPWVRQNAAEALGLLSTNAIKAIPALVQALDETDPRTLQEIALALGAMGFYARSALPLLTNLLGELPELFAARAGIGDDRKWELYWLRGAVARAIAQIDNTDKASLAVMFEHADSDAIARRFLAGLGSKASQFVPELTRKLARTNGQPQAATAELLWHIDPNNAAIVPALKQVMQYTNSAMRAYAAYWYWRATGDAETTIKVIVAGLEEPPSNSSQMFPQWLGQMEAAARPAVPALMKALWHHNIYARRNAGKALEKVDAAALDGLKPRN
jgi:HEAT repeat protein